MARIVFISCVKKKIVTNTPTPAKDLYQSPLFKKALQYAECVIKADKIFIFSAKYYLLKPEDKITYYDKTLNNMTSDEIKEWSAIVRSKIIEENIDLDNDEIVLLAGKNYYKYLETEEFRFANVEYKYKNLRIGKILQHLNNKDL
jgi:cytoplasmic iron level regulating protein YaaA (DUF328/UPF0246 family)